MARAELGMLSSIREPDEAAPHLVDPIDIHARHFSKPSGGDLFDSVRVGTRAAFLLCDVAGRRPELNPILAEVQRVFQASSNRLLTAIDLNLMEATEALILEINHALIEAASGVHFAPTTVGCYDVNSGVLAYINAGGQTALLHDSEGARELPVVSVPLGLFTHITYDASIQAFEPGAMLLAVTKGVIDSIASKNRPGSDQIVELLQSSRFKSASELCEGVLKAAYQHEKRRRGWLLFRGRQVREDMTALAMIRIA